MGSSTLRPAEVTPDDISLLHLGSHTTARTVYGLLHQIQQSRLHSALLCREGARHSPAAQVVPPRLDPSTRTLGGTMTDRTTWEMISAVAVTVRSTSTRTEQYEGPKLVSLSQCHCPRRPCAGTTV